MKHIFIFLLRFPSFRTWLLTVHEQGSGGNTTLICHRPGGNIKKTSSSFHPHTNQRLSSVSHTLSHIHTRVSNRRHLGVKKRTSEQRHSSDTKVWYFQHRGGMTVNTGWKMIVTHSKMRNPEKSERAHVTVQLWACLWAVSVQLQTCAYATRESCMQSVQKVRKWKRRKSLLWQLRKTTKPWSKLLRLQTHHFLLPLPGNKQFYSSATPQTYLSVCVSVNCSSFIRAANNGHPVVYTFI